MLTWRWNKRARTGLRSERGSALLEALIASFIVGIAAVGLALMYSSGNTWAVAMGDDRIGVWVAQQKVEQLRARGFGNVPEGDSVTRPCPFGGGPPCYSEVTGTAWDGPVPAGTRLFTRLTCVQNVDDTVGDGDPIDFNEAPDPNIEDTDGDGKIDRLTCLPGLAGSSARRVTVIVVPDQREAAPVQLQAWITTVMR